ncbi:MAG: heavy metal-associated domain-containing protein [Candidatus Latescibacteria bacterium]|nr:heavy metal-associated domain-containing protein [Candidatus Latescibacterota bacterium]
MSKQLGYNTQVRRWAMARTTAALIWLALALPSVCFAELRAVRVTIGDMDCAACPHVIRVAVSKLKGVDSVAVSRDQRALDIRLLPGNEITLGRLHRIVRDRGFEPERADAQVSGKVVSHGGRPALHMGRPDVVYLIEDGPGALGSTEKIVREALGKWVVAEGEIRETRQDSTGVPDDAKRPWLLLRDYVLIPGE